MEKFKYLSKDKISQIPKGPGVYAFKKGGKFLYVGKAANIKERVKNHLQQPGYRDNLFINQAEKIGYIKTNSEIEALILEANLIKKYQPKYNVVWRDDKNYFFVRMTKEDFPRIFITHQPISQKFHDREIFKNFIRGIEYVGPFVDGKALKQTLKILRKVFPYRSCYKIPNRPCLWYHLNRCPAPCLLKFSKIPLLHSNGILEKTGEKIKKASQRNTKNLIKILKEGKSPVLRDLKREMKLASKKQDFEEAARIRDQIVAVERIMDHAKIFEPGPASGYPISEMKWPEIQKALQKLLKTKKTTTHPPPSRKQAPTSRIEAYDVSNIQGQEATGSMVTFVNGLPDKSFYRKFKIKVAGKPNDIAMIKECLKRRIKHREWGWPDLILIDGGKAQLNAARQCLRFHLKQVKVVALAKKRNELFVENQKKPILLKNLPREIFNLILQLRDEAHRFAKNYHKKLREKRLIP